MTVLGRRALVPGRPRRLVLARPDLRGADLAYANLTATDLFGAHLENALLRGAHLEEARATPATSWPNGFNWKDAVHMLE